MQKVITAIDILQALQLAMIARGIPLHNCIGFPGFNLGSSLPPHADNTFVTRGISLLDPRSHLGEITLY
ncbi:hypothetical protein, partial [Streptococcus pneumoniae]|uniref:hypothetical protein n=1 Tax=Streptococcus pneumoniae TaxID=1313 RepID=UPI001E4593E6